MLTDTNEFNYIGVSEQPLRKRVATHKYSFNSNNNQTELSVKVKQLTREGTAFSLEYHLMETKEAYTPERGKCNLCLAETYQILFSGLPNLLNSKQELTATCRHRAKYKLINN